MSHGKVLIAPGIDVEAIDVHCIVLAVQGAGQVVGHFTAVPCGLKELPLHLEEYLNGFPRMQEAQNPAGLRPYPRRNRS